MHPLVYKAQIYATGAHAAVGQVRSESNLPYIVHPIEVADILASVGAGYIEQTAAMLHDVIEDTQITFEQLVEEFGYEVASLVRMATNPAKLEDGDRATRALINLTHKAKASAEGQDLILADTISNMRTFRQLKPSFAKIYVPEKYRVVQALTLGNPELIEMAQSAIADAAAELGIALEVV